MALQFGATAPSINNALYVDWVDELDKNGTLRRVHPNRDPEQMEDLKIEVREVLLSNLQEDVQGIIDAFDTKTGINPFNGTFDHNKLYAILRSAAKQDAKYPGYLDWLESQFAAVAPAAGYPENLYNQIHTQFNVLQIGPGGYKNIDRWVDKMRHTAGWMNIDGEILSPYMLNRKSDAWRRTNQRNIEKEAEAKDKALKDEVLEERKKKEEEEVEAGERLPAEQENKLRLQQRIDEQNRERERAEREADIRDTAWETAWDNRGEGWQDRNKLRERLDEEDAQKNRDLEMHGRELSDVERNKIEGRARRKAVLEEELRLKVAERQRFKQDLDNVGQGFHDEQEIRKLASMLVNEERDARGEKTIPLRDDGNAADGTAIGDIEKFEEEVSKYLNDNVGLHRPSSFWPDNNPFRESTPPSKGEGIWAEDDKSLASDIQDAREKSTKESLDGTREELAKNLRDAQIAGKESEVIKAREALSNYDSEMLKGKHALYVPEDPLGERDRITAGMKGVRESLANAQLALREAEEDGDEEQIDFQKTQIAQYEGELKKAEKELENLKPASVRDRLVDTLMRKGKSHVQGAADMGMSREEAEREADILYQRAVEDEKAEAAADARGELRVSPTQAKGNERINEIIESDIRRLEHTGDRRIEEDIFNMPDPEKPDIGVGDQYATSPGTAMFDTPGDSRSLLQKTKDRLNKVARDRRGEHLVIDKGDRPLVEPVDPFGDRFPDTDHEAYDPMSFRRHSAEYKQRWHNADPEGYMKAWGMFEEADKRNYVGPHINPFERKLVEDAQRSRDLDSLRAVDDYLNKESSELNRINELQERIDAVNKERRRVRKRAAYFPGGDRRPMDVDHPVDPRLTEDTFHGSGTTPRTNQSLLDIGVDPNVHPNFWSHGAYPDEMGTNIQVPYTSDEPEEYVPLGPLVGETDDVNTPNIQVPYTPPEMPAPEPEGVTTRKGGPLTAGRYPPVLPGTKFSNNPQDRFEQSYANDLQRLSMDNLTREAAAEEEARHAAGRFQPEGGWTGMHDSQGQGLPGGQMFDIGPSDNPYDPGYLRKEAERRLQETWTTPSEGEIFFDSPVPSSPTEQFPRDERSRSLALRGALSKRRRPVIDNLFDFAV